MPASHPSSMALATPRDELSAPQQRRLLRTRLIAIVLLLLLAVAGGLLAQRAQRGFADVHITELTVMTPQNVPMVMKLYRPGWVDSAHPAPGILALHGYQSEKDATVLFGATELARRGFVVLAPDHFGHGDSTAKGVAPAILSGAQYAYDTLRALPFVNPRALGVFGHSTGAVYAVSLAEAHPEIGAIVALSGNGGAPQIPQLRNYLLVQGHAEEIPVYREKTFPIAGLDKHPARLKAFGREQEGVIEWNTTYGSFADGSARRAELVYGTHLGVMISPAANAAVVNWFHQAFGDQINAAHWLPPDQQVYRWTIVGGLIMAVALLLSLAPVLDLVLRWPALRPAIIGEGTWQGPRGRGRLGFVLLSIAASMVLWPVFTQWGGGKDPVAGALPIFPLEMGNGILVWLVASCVLTALLVALWRWRGAGRGENARTLGLLGPGPQPWCGVWAGVGVALALLVWLLLVTALLRWAGLGDVRVIWPLLRGLTTERAAFLLPYGVVIALFFFIVNGLSASVVGRVPAAGRSDLRLWLARTGWTSLALVGGLVILGLIQFVPLMGGATAGMDALGLPQFSGRWSMMLWVVVPQFLMLIAVTTWVQVRSRSIWAGTMLGAMLFTWMLVGTQVMR